MVINQLLTGMILQAGKQLQRTPSCQICQNEVTWMSRDRSDRINGDRINGLFHLLINGVYWGYNPFTNFLGHPSTPVIKPLFWIFLCYLVLDFKLYNLLPSLKLTVRT